MFLQCIGLPAGGEWPNGRQTGGDVGLVGWCLLVTAKWSGAAQGIELHPGRRLYDYSCLMAWQPPQPKPSWVSGL